MDEKQALWVPQCAYPLIKDQKYPVRPRKEPRFCRLVSVFQLTTVVNLVRSSLIPSGPTLAPAKVASVTKNLDFAVDSERPFSLIHCNSLQVFASMVSK